MGNSRAKGWKAAAAANLKKLYDSNVKISQANFGGEYGIGSQSMVWQYLTGYRPVGLYAAIKFASGIGCSLADIHPKLEEQRNMLATGVAGGDLLAGLDEPDKELAIEYIQLLRDRKTKRPKKRG